jgi:probable HAF family extracellular repeat protein
MSVPSYTFIDLNQAGQSRSIALSINNLGQVALIQTIRTPVNKSRSSVYNLERVPAIWDNHTTHLIPGYEAIAGYSDIRTINELGQVLFRFSTNTGTSRVGVWSKNDNSVTYFGGLSVSVWDMNNSGQIVGTSGLFQVTWIDASRAPTTISHTMEFSLNSINNIGQMAGGAFFNGSTHVHALVKDDDTFLDLGTLGGNSSYAYDISDTGYVIGRSQIEGGSWRTFISKDGEMNQLHYLPGSSSNLNVLSVNNLGQSVGSVLINGERHAILWNGISPIDLNDLLDVDSRKAGWILTIAYDINDHGWIVGEAYNKLLNQDHAFVLRTDEPILATFESFTYGLALADQG